jgi:hypothetical protein
LITGIRITLVRFISSVCFVAREILLPHEQQFMNYFMVVTGNKWKIAQKWPRGPRNSNTTIQNSQLSRQKDAANVEQKHHRAANQISVNFHTRAQLIGAE